MHTNIKRQSRLLARLLLTSALLLPGTAWAQSDDEPQPGDIVVTAQKRAQGINDVPIAISAFSAESLANSGVKSLDGLATVTPGLSVSETSATGVPIYTIRGIGFSDYSTSSSSTVGLYVDEVALPYAVMSRGALFDVGQVEVLKGPQGDLYGRNTTAGQINVNSAKPTAQLSGGLSADVSNFGETNLEGYVSGPLADGFNVRLAGKTSFGGAWQRSISRPGDKLGDKNVAAFRGSLQWQIEPEVDLFVSGHYIRDKSDNLAPTAYDGALIGQPTLRLPVITTGAAGSPTSVFRTGDPRAADWTAGAYTPRRDNELAGFVAKLNVDLGGVTLTSVTGYDRFTRSEANDWDGWAGSDSNNINDTKVSVLSQEARLSSSGKGPFRWIVGGYYSHDTMHESYNYFMQDSFYSLVLGIKTLNTRYTQKTESVAGFAHADYEFGDGWRLLGGFRYTSEERKWSGCTFDSGDGTLAGFLGLPAGSCGTFNDIAGTPTFGTAAVFSDTITTNRAMWKVGLDKKLGRSLIYGTVSNGFKSGGFSGINTNLWSQLLPYKPETVTVYELGAKLSLFDNALRLNASGFWYDYKDKQEAHYINTFVGALVQLTNVPRSRVRGFEVEGTWKLTDHFKLDGSATYLDAEITNWPNAGVNNGANLAVSTNLAGARLANSPSWQTTLGLTYEQPLSGPVVGLINLDMNSRTSSAGRVLALDPSTAIPGYTLFNARVGLKDADDSWSVTLWMRNIGDKYYYTSAFVGNGIFVRTNGMPRTFGVSGRVAF